MRGKMGRVNGGWANLMAKRGRRGTRGRQCRSGSWICWGNASPLLPLVPEHRREGQPLAVA